MESQNQNLSDAERSADATVVIDNGSADKGRDDCLESLPLKSQSRYKFIRSIGFGGMKGVLLVHDNDTDRDVAMAIIPDFRTRPLRDLNRFVREARITAKLEHPNIVPVYDLGIDNSGSPFFTMKYLRGSTLAVILRKLQRNDEETANAFSQERLLQVMKRVCNAVAFAHSQGICHLDLKPGNIHCGDFGEVQVIDWGLAAAMKEGVGCGQINGTPGYMAPEMIIDGEKTPGPEADVYALGAILYAILTGDSPLAGLPTREALQRAVEGKIKPPSASGKPMPPGLEAVCMKAMSLNPADRYPSAIELRKEIVACMAGFPSQAENASLLRRGLLFLKRHILLVIITVLLFLSGLLAVLVYYYSKN